jgi:glucose/arabinose dehydrogenase
MRLLAVAAVLTLAAAACSGDDDDPTGSTALVPESASETTTTDEADTTTSSTVAPAVEDLSAAAVVLSEVAQVAAPTAMTARAGTDTLYVAERGGTVRPLTFTPLTGGGSRVEVGEVLVEVDTTNDSERGLLGIAFSADGGQLYLSFTDEAGNTRVDEWTMDGDAVEDASRREIFATEQPFGNHNGGDIGFGPDGYLYIGLGDGGSGGDPLANAQDPTRVLGSMLRIDPASPADGRAYGIPDDNPYADGAGGAQPETWAIGLRNPWRFSWDSQTGDMWIGDVGQNRIEEISVLVAGPDVEAGESTGTAAGAGANLGWPIFEGDDPFAGGDPPAGYVPPVFDYAQGPGCSVTGGFVSRGDWLPALRGAYLYSDYCDPTIRALLALDGQLVEERSLDVTVPGGQVASFGQANDGTLYVLSLAGGIYRIDPA